MQIFKDIEQGTDEWHALRIGLVTMSKLQCLLVSGKALGSFGTGAVTYMNELIGERFTGLPVESFSTASTERGHRDEVVACELYELENDCKVDHVTFITNHGVGYSPDGMVGSSGLIEIKSKLPKLQVEIFATNEVPAEHEAQIQGGLWVSDRDWLDFISYCDGMPTFTKRVYRDEKEIRTIARRVSDFYDLLERRMETVIKNSRGS